MTELPYAELEDRLDPGNRRVVGQQQARLQLSRILTSGRLSHAYLFAGPVGSGKKALALSFAEAINGIENLSDLHGKTFSKKSGWAAHPDIHFFLPLPSGASFSELQNRTKLLAADPYDVVDFSLRPTIDSDTSGANKNAFYSVDYFRDEIRPKAYLRPNEGYRNVIILTNIETMRAEVANAFLKILEEPPPNLMFLLTTDNPNALLPTIISRCQLIRCNPLTVQEIENQLQEKDGVSASDAAYLARASGGNYSLTKFYDVDHLKSHRNQVVEFMRYAYTRDALNIVDMAARWHADLNREGQVSILNMLELFIRDLAIYRDTRSEELITNRDQAEVIRKFCDSLGDADLDKMQGEIESFRRILRQNVSPKLAFTVLANRYSEYMRGRNAAIADDNPWKHMPATTRITS